MGYLHLLLNCAEFKFNSGDPTASAFNDPVLLEARERLTTTYLKKAYEDLTTPANSTKKYFFHSFVLL
jgi:hypothetical protein